MKLFTYCCLHITTLIDFHLTNLVISVSGHIWNIKGIYVPSGRYIRAYMKHQRDIRSLGRYITFISQLNPLMFGLGRIYIYVCICICIYIYIQCIYVRIISLFNQVAALVNTMCWFVTFATFSASSSAILLNKRQVLFSMSSMTSKIALFAVSPEEIAKL